MQRPVGLWLDSTTPEFPVVRSQCGPYSHVTEVYCRLVHVGGTVLHCVSDVLTGK